MTAKEIAHWQGWHRRGRKSFQRLVATLWFSGFGLLGALLQWILRDSVAWQEKLLAALLTSIGIYFAAGFQWDQRTKEALAQEKPEAFEALNR